MIKRHMKKCSLGISSHQEDANRNYSETSSSHQGEWHQSQRTNKQDVSFSHCKVYILRCTWTPEGENQYLEIASYRWHLFCFCNP